MDALLSLADPKIYEVNAFRVTGLPVDATEREVARHLEKQRMAKKLRFTGEDNGHIFPPSEPPSLDAIREAAHQLKDPETRLLHEIFWFWPLPGKSSGNDPALQAMQQGRLNDAVNVWTAAEGSPLREGAVAKHNLAVLYHHLAIRWEAFLSPVTPSKEDTEKVDTYWRSAITRWAELCHSDGFWGHTTARIRAINDPRLRTDVARGIKWALPTAICLIGAKVAVVLAQSRTKARASAIVAGLRSAFLAEVIDEAFKRAVVPALETIKALCGAAEEEAKRAPEGADRVTQKLLSDARRSLDTVAVLFKLGELACDGPFDQVALCGMDCMIPFANATENWAVAVPITEKLLELAVSESAQERIRTNLEAARKNSEEQRLERVLGPVVELVESILNEPSPVRKLSRLKAEAWPRVAALQQRTEVSQEEFQLVATRLGWALRTVGVELFNDLSDWNLGSEAINLAMLLAHSEELRTKLRDDRLALDLRKPKSQCFIATVAFGDEYAQEVTALRTYRDSVLMKSIGGRAFVRTYYRLSPRIARALEGNPRRKAITRWLLMPLVRRCHSALARRGALEAMCDQSGTQGRATDHA